MTPGLWYVLGTALTWLGWLLAASLAFRLIRWLLGERTAAGGLLALCAAVVGSLMLGLLMLPAQARGWRLPLFWPVLSWRLWASLAFLALGIAGAGRCFSSLRAGRSSLIWTALALLCAAALFGLDRTTDTPAGIVRGSIELEPRSVAIVAALAALAFGTMRWVERMARAKALAKNASKLLALLLGAALFGLPFYWLLLTSFKEDRDMATNRGIVWVPRVQLTLPYDDPRDPLFRATYQGKSVTAALAEPLRGEVARLEVLRPISMRGINFQASVRSLVRVPKDAPVVVGKVDGVRFRGIVVQELRGGLRLVRMLSPSGLAGRERAFAPTDLSPVRRIAPRWQNYTDALEFMPPETLMGLLYLRNTLILVVMGVIGTVASSAVVAYAFSHLRFPGRNTLFVLLLSTLMLPSAVTLLPRFLVFRSFGWINTLYPIWVPAFFGSAFYVFLLRQFLMNVPRELDEAAKIDGASHPRIFWSVLLPQVRPALAVVAIGAFVDAWNNFMGPLIYVTTPENMPLSYALQLFQSERASEPGLLMAFATLSMLPVLMLFFFAQRYFTEGVTLTGFGGR